jgi:asparagine synthetase B (glutamine-hydrolysing)
MCGITGVIDLTENVKQPIRFNHFSITYNGEIYDYKEIKLELENISVMFGHKNITGVTFSKTCEEEFKNLTNLLKQ